MRALSGQEILRIWEIGVGQHFLDRALIILAVAFPETSPEALAALNIGERDARLLSVREWTFGSGLNGYAECPQCQERLKFTLPVANIRAASPSGTARRAYELFVKGFDLRFRLLDSRDLRTAMSYEDLDKARHFLVECCLLQASRGKAPLASSELPAEIIAALAARIAECDPQAEVLLDLDCPACGHRWQVLFDITTFFWTELVAQAKHLLREVHTLARAYGWHEADILAMTAWRRQCYLEMVGA